MKRFYQKITSRPKLILLSFGVLFLICLACKPFISVNYDMNDYLPSDSASTIALDTMEQEYEGGIPNTRVMIENVSVAQALQYKVQIAAVDGVTNITWLDDAASVTQPLSFISTDTLDTYYKDGNALFSVTVSEDKRIAALDEIREIIGDKGAMTGSAVSTATATKSTASQIPQIAVFGVLFTLLVLILTTTSFAEPLIVLLGLGLAIIINSGSNLIFGEISFVTNAAGSILQLAVSLDYSVFLLHRFTECRKEFSDPKEAMVQALCGSTASILSSGLTTVIGFLALCLMRFKIGPDLGLALAKGVAISLITVFVFMPVFILATYKWIDKTQHRPFVPSFRGFGKLVSKMMIPLVCLFAVVIVPSFLASNSNSFYYGASHIFGSETQLGADTEKIEEIFGKSDTYVLMVPKDSVATQKELSETLHTLPEVKSILSYVDTAGETIPEQYLDTGTLSKLNSADYTRMVLSVDADYEGPAAFDLIETVQRMAEEYYPGEWLLAGEGVSTHDLMNTVTADMLKVNLIAIAAVFVVLLLTAKSVSIPIILVLGIETAVWLNLSIPYFTGSAVFYIAYLIISSIQLGATVDYAILFTDRYKEYRETRQKKQAIIDTVSAVTVSIMTSASVLTVVGFLLGAISTHGLLSQLGYFLGKGTLCSLAIVLFVLPGMLYLFDGLIQKTTKGGKFIAALLAAVMTCSLTVPAFAAEAASEKEEVIYINTDAAGHTTSVNAVNIFGGGDIVDFGNYSDVNMLTSTESITQNGDKITFSTDDKKVYYQGTMKNTEIPWDISVRYYLDGKEYRPSEIVGQSGKLEIRLSIAKNEKCRGDFFENYALQVSVTLDTGICENIIASDATMANVGDDKQITYTVLPGKGLDSSITAHVSEFEMDAISVNGIKLNLNVEVDDAGLMDQVSQLMDAAKKLNDGSGELISNSETLKTGSSSLDAGFSSVHSGVADLDNGIAALQEGISSAQAALDTLNDKSCNLINGSAQMKSALEIIQTNLSSVSVSADQLAELTGASSAIKQGISDLYDGAYALSQNLGFAQYKAIMAQNGLDIDALQAGNTQALNDLAALITSLQQTVAQLENVPEYEAQVAQLQSQIASLQSVIQLLSGSNAAIGGTESYLDNLAAGVDSLYQSLGALKTQYELFDEKIGELAGTLSDMLLKLSVLSGKIDQLVTNYAFLDSGISEYTGGVAQLAAGYTQIVDGVSSLASGSKTLLSGSSELKNGAGELYDGIAAYCDGVSELADGTNELYTKSDGMDTQVQEQIDEILASIGGEETETVSFVSGKNTNVNSVQFVMKTAAIEKEEVVTNDMQEEAPLNFWQKLLRLFGMY